MRLSPDRDTVRYGVEEEFFLVRLDDLSIVRRPPRRFLRDCRNELGERISVELLQSQVELTSPILTSTDSSDALQDARSVLRTTAMAHGMSIIAAGTHPLAQWRGQVASNGVRYRRLFEDFQIIANRNLLCGLHVHAEIPSGIDRIRVINGVMHWLPLLLCLSASSPFWAREDSGLASYRQAAYDEWPRTGIPRFFTDEVEYRRYIAILKQTDAIADESYIWWAIRPSAKYPTIELRIADACPRIRDAACVAALFRTAVHHQLRIVRSGVPFSHDPVERLLIEENRWRAKRFGTDSKLLSVDSAGAVVSLGKAIAKLAESAAESAAALGTGWALDHAVHIARDGSSANRQRHVYSRKRLAGSSHVEALRAVVESLVIETATY